MNLEDWNIQYILGCQIMAALAKTYSTVAKNFNMYHLLKIKAAIFSK
jgi:hypothetical protein